MMLGITPATRREPAISTFDSCMYTCRHAPTTESNSIQEGLESQSRPTKSCDSYFRCFYCRMHQSLPKRPTNRRQQRMRRFTTPSCPADELRGETCSRRPEGRALLLHVIEILEWCTRFPIQLCTVPPDDAPVPPRTGKDGVPRIMLVAICFTANVRLYNSTSDDPRRRVTCGSNNSLVADHAGIGIASPKRSFTCISLSAGCLRIAWAGSTTECPSAQSTMIVNKWYK
ncbi:uncharacterized protein C8Q71DRAFT_418725 [Rhodofomes roseus]|uniref:Uncharacterized protein n=1 Tax=Rhodofomes roseus TaxID=34475 RepID=A0ABQ8KQM4_9APHY|nr:uncharacterized protein C8Q71DRAFT_418725 [Rhodofomes roseus]KAH9840662.1 hypothetical protein C8Q71DRAFT_418725 [Rhodofomes roseus]